ncbi:hypothetical protein HA402_007490 [Bradysia odoriphaga]|nr:hypothetical protein HA402_007490 [Bradysia odoriphaga]
MDIYKLNVNKFQFVAVEHRSLSEYTYNYSKDGQVVNMNKQIYKNGILGLSKHTSSSISFTRCSLPIALIFIFSGVWNVPFISTCYLVKSAVLPKISYKQYEVLDAEMSFCKGLREQDIFLYSMNLKHYGHLMNGEHYNTVLARPDFYMLFDNRPDWEQRYIHKEYSAYLEPNVTFKQPCPDVYWFPIVTEKFCDDLVAIAENFGKWSDGSNSDERLQGGYEAVPTRDIHMTQVGLQSMYLKFLQLYVRPLQEAVFMGYYHNPPNSLMNFVVRYKPTEQPKLRPHHDSSTYTINIALNTAGVDYEGGGCRFLRYNCSVTDTEKGWMLMHPGRLTHFHEGLETTKGTRYIMISFVDP